MSRLSNVRQQRGFTIIEITISMAFISVLILSLLVIGMHLTALYNKGVTVRDVNAATRHMVRSLQDDISGAATRPVIVYKQVTGSGSSTIETPKVASSLEEASDNGAHYYNNDDGGRLCTGTYTYIWNYRGAFVEANKAGGKTPHASPSASVPGSYAQYVEQTRNGVSVIEPARFIKVEDVSRELCKKDFVTAGPDAHLAKAGTKIPASFGNKAVSVLGDSERGLIVYNFRILSPEYGDFEAGYKGESAGTSTNLGNEVATRFYSSFYTINTTIGSSLFNEEYIGVQDDKNVGSTVNCGSKNIKGDAYAEYCAINNIEFVVRTGSF